MVQSHPSTPGSPTGAAGHTGLLLPPRLYLPPRGSFPKLQGRLQNPLTPRPQTRPRERGVRVSDRRPGPDPEEPPETGQLQSRWGTESTSGDKHSWGRRGGSGAFWGRSCALLGAWSWSPPSCSTWSKLETRLANSAERSPRHVGETQESLTQEINLVFAVTYTY